MIPYVDKLALNKDNNKRIAGLTCGVGEINVHSYYRNTPARLYGEFVKLSNDLNINLNLVPTSNLFSPWTIFFEETFDWIL